MNERAMMGTSRWSILLLLVSFGSLMGCDRESESAADQASSSPTQVAARPTEAEGTAKAELQKTTKGATQSSKASVGESAPSFSLPNLKGEQVSLADFQGKTVVLEWFNPKCPFVKASHTKGSLVDAAARAEESGVVWLAINSGAPDKQGHGLEANEEGKEAFGLTHPILLDESGKVGRAYGATNTPHMFVIDPKGILVYQGAVDNSPDGEGGSPQGGKLISYVDQALAELAAGKTVSVKSTKAYGCGVKY